jgi:TRAP-type mannitol/chloroaromatic compound transport system substrate-binding protein
MLGELLEVVNKLSEVSDRLQQTGEARRKRIADYFLSIEECLCDSVEQLKNNQAPNSRWGELKVYARKLQTTIGKEIGKDTAEELSLLLLSTAKNIPTENDIPSIETAAGTFKGLANTVTTKETENNSSRRRLFTYSIVGALGLTGGLLLDRIRSSESTNQPSGGDPPPTDQPIQIADSEAFPYFSWEMHTFLSDSVSRTILFNAPQQVCDRVRDMTQNRFDISLKRTGETEEILRKVSDGEIDCGFSGIYYSTPKYKSLFLGCAVPFGLTPQEQTAWLNYRKEQSSDLTFIQSIYSERLNLNIIPFPAAATGGQMGGWFREKISSIDDLKDKVMRIPGLGAEVIKRIGMKTHEEFGQITVAESIQRLQDGRFFAVEWTSPHDDLELGLDEAAKFYYYPGWWEPSTTFDVQVNMDAWRQLPSSYQEIFRIACQETYISILTEYDQKNSLALQEIPNRGVEIIKFSPEILEVAQRETQNTLEINAQQDENFKEVYDEWLAFKGRIRNWSNLTRIDY